MAEVDGLEDLTVTLRSAQASWDRARGGGPGPASLLIFEAGTCRTLLLPAAGEVVIGRAPEAHLRLEDTSVSRLHAKLLVAGRDIRVLDLGSHNGTRVNGEVIRGSRPLIGGDVITVCASAALVLHRPAAPNPTRVVLDGPAFLARIEEEAERAVGYGTSFCVLSVAPSGERAPRAEELVAAIAPQLRLLDVVARPTEDRIELLCPELGRGEVVAMARALAGALAAAGLAARLGVASCPDDGLGPDALLSAARAAARQAPIGGAVPASEVRVDRVLDPETAVTLADPAMLRLYGLVEKLAAAEVPILINGETGSGKELVARAIHTWSRRKDGPFVALNCATIPEGLIESELFGHEKGAFSGATASKQGLFEGAAGGTVFLDEIGELPPATQAKLLRVLETKRLLRLGDLKERPIDVRVVCATHRDLEAEVRSGRFRQDLLYRLNTARLVVPPLRQRPREIPILARRFLAHAQGGDPDHQARLAPSAMKALLEHPWPGNVRELKNAMDYVAATLEGELVERWHLPAHIGRVEPEPSDGGLGEGPVFRPIAEEIEELERRRMGEALAAAGGVQKRAAALIGMPLRTFVGKLKTYQLGSGRASS